MKKKQEKRIIKQLTELSKDPEVAEHLKTFNSYQRSVDQHFEATELTMLIDKHGRTKNEQTT